MFLLGVVNQRRGGVVIIVDYTHLTRLDGGFYLDEEFKSKIGRYPKTGEQVKFIIKGPVNIIPNGAFDHGINSGDNWSASNKIHVDNYATVYGRGGDGGEGAFVLNSFDSTTPSIRIAAKPGAPGLAAIANTTTAPITVNNYGSIISGGGGGGGGASYEYTLPERYNNDTWFALRNGTMSGGGAPNGRRSGIVGSTDWYIRYVSKLGEVENNLAAFNAQKLNRTSPTLGIKHREYNQVNHWYFNTSSVDVNNVSPLPFTIDNKFSHIKYTQFNDLLPMGTVNEVLMYPRLIADDYANYPLAKRYGQASLVRQAMVHSSLTLNYGLGPHALLGTDATPVSPGWGGASPGVSHKSNGTYYGWDATVWYGVPSAEYILPVVWDDNFGGDGGEYASHGRAGRVEHLYAKGMRQGTAGTSRAKKFPREYFENNKHLMTYEPPARGGHPGYATVGDVSILNKDGGVVREWDGKFPNEVVASTTFQYYYTQTELSANRSSSRHVLRTGPVTSSGFEFTGYVDKVADYRGTVWSALLTNTPPVELRPYLELRDVSGITHEYIFRLTLPDEYDINLHNVTFAGSATATLNGNVVTVTVPGTFKFLVYDGGGYGTYDADSILTVSLVNK